jgi:hypothetical protein
MKIIDGFILREIMGQATVIGEGVEQVNFNKIITLNSSAAYLWPAVEGEDFDVAKIADLLIEEYNIDRQTAEKDAKTITDQWIEVGIVK